MVDLQNLKNAITGSPFSDEAKQELNTILDAAISRGFITPEEKQKALGIINIEMQVMDISQNTDEKIAEALETFVAETEASMQTASDEIDSMSEEEKVQVAQTEEIPQSVAPPEQPVSAPEVVTTPAVPVSEVPPQPPTQ